jgi:hypothetical protein
LIQRKTCAGWRQLHAVAICIAAGFNLSVQPNGTDPFGEKFFTPARFGILLALLAFASFPQVVLGLETFVARDFGFFAYPLAHFQQECFQSGDLPFWNPYNNCGVPFLAQWNTMPLYPPALFYLLLPLKWALSMFSLLHLWWAGLGMYFLARRWTGNNFAAAFAGVAFAFNGFTLNLLMWPSHIATFSWMPWVILAAQLAWRDGMEKIILASFVGALQMLAGGPETIFLTWAIASALWLGELAQRAAGVPRADQTGKNFASSSGNMPAARYALLWRFPLVVALVILLTLPQLLPFLDLVAHSQRESGFADLRWSMPGFGLANFLVPTAFGSTATEGIFFQHGQYWTSSYYLGLGTLWLALLAAFTLRERRIWLLAGLAAAGLILALGENTPVLPLIRKMLPQLSFITYPVKYVMVVVFAAPLLAALALANLEKIQKKILPLGIILFALLLGVIVWTQTAPLPGDNSQLALTTGLSRVAFLVFTGVILFALTRKAPSVWLRFAPLLLILTAWTDVYTHAPQQNPTAPPWIFEPNLSREKLALNPQPELGGSRAMVSPAAAYWFVNFAVSDAKNNFLAKRLGYCANCNVLDAAPKVDGFFSLTPRANDAVLSLFYTTTNASYPGLEAFMGVSQITAPGDALYRWQARTNFLPLVTAGQQPVFADDAAALAGLTQAGFDGGKVVFLPPEARPFVSATNFSRAKILDAKFGIRTVDIEAEADAASLVVIAQTYYHNWSAKVDGRETPLLRANVAFQAVQIPAGKHRVHLAYNDLAFQIGAGISLCTIFNCLFGLALMTIRRHARPKPVIESGDSLF